VSGGTEMVWSCNKEGLRWYERVVLRKDLRMLNVEKSGVGEKSMTCVMEAASRE